MPALYIMIPAALLIVGIAVAVFFWAVDSGQYDDLDSPAQRILFDDQDLDHQAAARPAPSRAQGEAAAADPERPDV